MSRRYSIDSMVVRDTRAYGWGWYLDDAAPARAIHLRLHLADGSVRDLRCTRFGSRPDLAQAFPQVPHAVGGGFMVQARLPATTRHAELHVDLTDGREDTVALPGFPGAYAPAGPRGWKGGWQRLWQALAGTGSPFSPPSRRGARWVVFDHVMGGGANRFRDERVAEWRAAGHDVVLVTPLLSTLEYEASGVDARGRAWRQRHPDLGACLAALGACAQLVVNDLPSFDDPLRVLDWARARQREGARVLCYLHDFHAACPVWTLAGSDGRDCGIPVDPGACARCLSANHAAFLGMMPSLDIAAWRQAWARFLAGADEVVAFSASSVETLQRAFPGIDLRGKVAVRPHDTAYLGPPPPPYRPVRGEVATIAVAGFINEHKGAGIVREMAAIIERERLPARIVVFGTLDGMPESPALRITGPYEIGELGGLLEREGVSLAFLPSIVRETFSYVTAELMHHGVPLAVFDLGAPAERVRDWPLGRVIPAIDARTALDELLDFHRDLSAMPGPAGAIAQTEVA